jgi:hypothetical protein
MLVQLVLIVHVIKTGRSVIWVFVLLFFPVIGGFAYLIVELLPEFTNSPSARSMRRGLARTLNPNRGLQDASRNLTIAHTAQYAIELGNELLERSQYADAKAVFEGGLQGIHAHDPELLLGLANAHYGLGAYPEALEALDTLKEHNPESTSAEGHLLYAKALEGVDRTDAAIEEYEALMRYYSGPEPLCRLAKILKARGDTGQANELFQKVVRTSETAGKHYNRMYREWVRMAKDEVSG